MKFSFFYIATILLLSFCLTGCAKLSYLIDQGKGQWELMAKGRENDEVLKDSQVDDSIKEKIRHIKQYKKHFYSYFKREATDIYTETTFLEREAVTYLVIASAYDEIKAHKECFIFMGCFPYLGFFNEEKAKSYAKDLEKDDLVTYIRPVRAYSTLGYLDDNILSTFFLYDEKGLAELIFHELFHTVFFIKDDVSLNENLANFVGKKMMHEYFSYSQSDIKREEKLIKKRKKLNEFIVKQVKIIQSLYLQKEELSKDEANQIFTSYMTREFKPKAEELCRKLSIDYCFPLKRSWNNASLTAFLTYEEKMSTIEKHYQKFKSLPDFLAYLERRYKEYKGSDRNKMKFSDFLWGQGE